MLHLRPQGRYTCYRGIHLIHTWCRLLRYMTPPNLLIEAQNYTASQASQLLAGIEDSPTMST